MTTEASATLRPQTITINDKKELYRSYMPFIQGGALFIQFNDDITPDKIQPGQKILLIFSMLDNKQRIAIQGKVVWISKHGMNKGYGVALGDSPQMKSLKESIESNIADLMAKKEPTSTF